MRSDLIALALVAMMICTGFASSAYVMAHGKSGGGWILFVAFLIFAATKVSIDQWRWEQAKAKAGLAGEEEYGLIGLVEIVGHYRRLVREDVCAKCGQQKGEG